MKYTHVIALLGLTQVQFNKNLFGGASFAKFSEEEVEKIDQALAKNSTEELQAELEQLKAEKATVEAELNKANETNNELVNAVEQALDINNLSPEGTIAESVVKLGATCKEYGDKKTVNTIVKHDGKDTDPSNDNKLIDGVLDPNAPHNKLD